MNELKVIELFAGVGGFRVGLERADSSIFKTIWANQWEPATKTQHAADIYRERFGDVCNEDINNVKTEDIPDHDMMVGGFPCQDYSVASTLNHSKGIEGKKGVLWWSIYRILKEKGEKRPKFVLLENVDRLLKSPAKQRGRDFAIILECLNSLGYIVEWRVINAAEYGMPQRRRRTYILAYKPERNLVKGFYTDKDLIYRTGFFAKAFPVIQNDETKCFTLSELYDTEERITDISNNFGKPGDKREFLNAGYVYCGTVYTADTEPDYKGPYMTIRDIMVSPSEVDESFYVSDEDIEKWKYFKGYKRFIRKAKDGTEYVYSEGAMEFPDSIDKPSRTIITSEGGKSPDRCRHIIMDQTGRYRRLTPVELERLSMFPDNHTYGVSDGKRAFLVGNALVCGIVEKIGLEIKNRL